MSLAFALPLALALVGLIHALAWLAKARMASREQALEKALEASEQRRHQVENGKAELRELVAVAFSEMSRAAVALHASARNATQSRSGMEDFKQWGLRLAGQVELFGELQDASISQGHELPRLVDLGQVLSRAADDSRFHADVQLVIGSVSPIQVMVPTMALTSAIQWLFDRAMDGKARQLRVTLDEADGTAHLSIWAGGVSIPHNLRSLLAIQVLRRMGARVFMATPPGHYLTIRIPLATSLVLADAGLPSRYESLTEQFQ